MTHSYNIILENKKAVYITLGCKLNYAETSTLRDRLMARGVVDAEAGEKADLCFVNTCSVTGEAEAKCRHAINRLHRQHPDAAIVVMGCYAQLSAEHLATIEGVTLVVGMENKGRVIELLEQHLAGTGDATFYATPLRDIRTFVPSCSRGERTRYFLKVQDGCNYYCTYCTIPIARGRSRNGSVASLVEQAREAAAAGGKEIVITGVNIGDFGRTTGETFFDLVRALDAVEGIERYRISSIEPNLLTDEIIDFCAHSRAFMPHFHIPLQCGNNEVLKLMRRHYDRELFAEKVHRCQELMPDCFIGVDVMVGSRGETPECFEDSYNFLDSLSLQHLHVFPYSERPGTMALRIPYVVSQRDKQARTQRMIELSDRKQREFIERYLGTVRPVLMEAPHGDAPMHGFTDNYIRVNVPHRPELVNTVVNVRLDSIAGPDLTVDATIV